MASLQTLTYLKTLQNNSAKCQTFFMITRSTSVVPRPKPKRGTIKHRHLIDSQAESLAARGFLRSQKPYTPPANIQETIHNIAQSLFGQNYNSNVTLSSNDKFNFLKACFDEVKHSVPNSMLHQIVNVNNVMNFYETPVTTTTPLDEMKNKDLPPNLHILYDYIRFHPERDTKFGGVTAFPFSSTVVTGLKYKDKYQGHKQRDPLYYDTWSSYIKE